MIIPATMSTVPTTAVVLPGRLARFTRISHWQLGRLKIMTTEITCVKTVGTPRGKLQPPGT